jgi:hypothetical protein
VRRHPGVLRQSRAGGQLAPRQDVALGHQEKSLNEPALEESDLLWSSGRTKPRLELSNSIGGGQVGHWERASVPPASSGKRSKRRDGLSDPIPPYRLLRRAPLAGLVELEVFLAGTSSVALATTLELLVVVSGVSRISMRRFRARPEASEFEETG